MSRRLLFVLWFLSINVQADYKDDIDYSRLQSELGSALPDGAGIQVTQVEAAIGTTENEVGAWMPDTASRQFAGKTIIDRSIPVSNGISGHATGVGSLLYGHSALAHAIDQVEMFSAEDWILDGFLKADTLSRPAVTVSRIANHSWVGEMDTAAGSAHVLRRLDWLVEQDEFIQVTAMNNGSSNSALLGSAYNSIAVGRTDTQHAQGSLALDSVYTDGRTRPDVVVPVSVTSHATPIVASSVALLIDQARIVGQGASTVISNGEVIVNGERSEVIKAVIMAGADRVTQNTSSSAQINDYRANDADKTVNGLDRRYGAGQLNVYSNFQIMAGGEQDSVQDGGAGTVTLLGYDYDDAFGGAAGSNRTASYQFDTLQGPMEMTASLVWNLAIEDSRGPGFDPVAALFDLNLFLYDVTGGSQSLLSSSESALDNTENIGYFLEQERDYQLVVEAIGNPFKWDYALAWKVERVPLLAAFWLFLSGIVAVFRFQPDRGEGQSMLLGKAK